MSTKTNATNPHYDTIYLFDNIIKVDEKVTLISPVTEIADSATIESILTARDAEYV